MGNAGVVPVCCVSKAARVVHPSGKTIVHMGERLTVRDLVSVYPHHYVTELDRQKQSPRRSMLPLEMELLPGHTYVVLPLPRLFTVKNRSPSNSFSRNRWYCLSTGGFSDSESSSDDEQRRRASYAEGGRFTVGSLLAMESCCVGLLSTLKYYDFNCSDETNASMMSLEMRHVLKCAELSWREMNEFGRSWRPDLESITEESCRPSPMRQTLESLMRQN